MNVANIRKASGVVSNTSLRDSAKTLLSVAAAALLLAGCTSFIPDYQRPAAPVAPAFPFDTAGSLSNIAAANMDWQQFFQDARLKQLISLALQNNRDLRVAALNIEQARAQLQIRRADEVPTIGIGATGSRQPGSNGSISSLYTAGFSVTGYELDFFSSWKVRMCS